ncbi:hypothetical protein [Peptoniphilus timonensis]|uniref:hypothetical protein n=1 Tax=Peptoniphilus timonensis TaxID=1268254 RepID=UPI00059540FB|nr:hypothetical protein [Peptoniphilus timonensis]
MWLIFGIGAIIFALLNVMTTIKNKNAERYRFLSLSLTALTVCAFYFDGASRVIKEDWGGLMDIMPTMSKALWVLVILSISVNSVSIFKKKRLNKN